MLLVVENTLVIVFSVHGTVRASSAQPPHRSTTISPSMLKASEAPRSSPDSSMAANNSRRGSNQALHVPPSTVGLSRMRLRSDVPRARSVMSINSGDNLLRRRKRRLDCPRQDKLHLCNYFEVA